MAEMLPRTLDRATLLRSVGWLRYQNAQGRNIYIRPRGEHHLSLVDDLTAGAVQRMKEEGFAPALVVETSPGNFQAWVNHGQVLEKPVSTLAARKLAERFGGDKGAADWRHFGRMVGLTNRKPSRRGEDGRFPFVRLIEATGAPYPERTAFIESLSAELAVTRRPEPMHSPARTSTARLTIDDFRSNPRFGGDGNRIDLAYAVYALAHGTPETYIRDAITSRDLSKKGPPHRQASYLERTLRKAAACVANSTGRG